MRETLRSFRANQSGGAALLFGLVAPVLLIGGGAAVTYGQARGLRTTEQAALDSAVLYGASLPTGTTDSTRIAAAQAAFSADMSTVAGRFTQPPTATFTVEALQPQGVRVTGTANAALANPFTAFVGARTIAIGTSATAQSGGPSVCMYALNNRANGAIDLNGTVNVASNCPVQANSGSGSAIRSVGGARMNTTGINVSGNYHGNGFAPPPTPGAAQLPDPLASVPFPPLGACASQSGTSIKTNTTLSPGTYCGGLNISSGAIVTLNPGVYIFTDGDFKIDSGAQVSGKEVMLAFTGKGAKFWMTGGAIMKVTSPISGTYMNMQFMEDRKNTAGNTWVSIGGNSQLQYDGVMYFPLSNIWIFGGSIVNANSPTITMLGDKLWFQDNSTINITQSNSRSLPVQAARVVLVR
jgi:Flp pilus assembly protein TadG